MGGCVSKSGEATFDDDLKPYERGTKKRRSSRKAKKAQKQLANEIAGNAPDDENTALKGDADAENPVKLVDDVVKRNSVYDNDDEKADENKTERPVPVPRTRSRENLVDSADDKPTVAPRRSSDAKSLESLDKSLDVDAERPVAAPRTSKSVRSQGSTDDGSQDELHSVKGRVDDGTKSAPRVNAVQVLPPLHGGFSLKKATTPVLERQQRVEHEEEKNKQPVIEVRKPPTEERKPPPTEERKPPPTEERKPPMVQEKAAASLDDAVAPPALPPKDVNQFLNDLDYAIPSEIMAAEATKPSPRKVMKPPKNEPVDPAQLIVQMRQESNPTRQTIDDHPPLPPACGPPDTDTGLYWVTDVTKNIPAEKQQSTFQSTKTTTTETKHQWSKPENNATTRTTVKTSLFKSTKSNNNNVKTDTPDSKPAVETTLATTNDEDIQNGNINIFDEIVVRAAFDERLQTTTVSPTYTSPKTKDDISKTVDKSDNVCDISAESVPDEKYDITSVTVSESDITQKKTLSNVINSNKNKNNGNLSSPEREVTSEAVLSKNAVNNVVTQSNLIVQANAVAQANVAESDRTVITPTPDTQQPRTNGSVDLARDVQSNENLEKLSLVTPEVAIETVKTNSRTDSPEQTPNVVILEKKETATTITLNEISQGVDKSQKVIDVVVESSESSSDSDYDDDLHPSKLEELKPLLCDMSLANSKLMKHHNLSANTRTRPLNHIKQWIKKCGTGENLLIMSGPVGMGKSCIVSHLCEEYKSDIIASHVFSHVQYHVDQNNFRSAISSCLLNICHSIPEFAEYLPSIKNCKEIMKCKDDNHFVCEMFINPIVKCQSPDGVKLIVFDAIEYCEIQQQATLVKFVEEFSKIIPSWLRMLVTIQSPSTLLDQLPLSINKLELKKSNDNYVDMKRLLKESMSSRMDRISLDGGLAQLSKKSEGFYLSGNLLSRTMLQMEPERKIALREIELLFPRNMNTLLTNIFTALRKAHPDAYESVITYLCLAREPLHISWFYAIFECSDKESVLQHLESIMAVLIVDDNQLLLCHSYLVSWLLDTELSGACGIDIVTARHTMAVLMMSWLSKVNSSESNSPCVTYALKYTVYHLCDDLKQQENLAKVLCDLSVIQTKLNTAGFSIDAVYREYDHQHVQLGSGLSQGNSEVVGLSAHLKSYPRLQQRIKLYREFVRSYQDQMTCRFEGNFFLQYGTCYTDCLEIKVQARKASVGPWLEDVMVQEKHSPFLAITPDGTIRACDISHDGSTIAVLCKQDSQLLLQLYNAQTGAQKSGAVDMKSVKERYGMVLTFLPGGNIFAGSLSSFVNPNQAKIIPSGFDMKGLQLKEKFSIECCASSQKYLLCGLTTLPWGGKSLHICVFDVKMKRCVRTIDVLHFRYASGTPQSAIKACGISSDKPLMCACVKESNRAQIRITIWNISKWQVMNSVDMNTDIVSKCAFMPDGTLHLGGGLQGFTSRGAKVRVWAYNDSKTTVPADEQEKYSVFNSASSCRWYENKDAVITCHGAKNTTYTIEGLAKSSDIFTSNERFVFVSTDHIHIYNKHDLTANSAGGDVQISDINVHSVTYLPKSDTVLLVCIHNMGSGLLCDVYASDLSQQEVSLHTTPFIKRPCKQSMQTRQYFMDTCSTLCQSSMDGNYIALNVTTKVLVWDRISDKVAGLSSDSGADVLCYVTSKKDNNIAIVYTGVKSKICTYDMKTTAMVRTLECEQQLCISDLIYLPSNGNVIAYQEVNEKKGWLTVWSKQDGSVISSELSKMSYARVSSSSDRTVLSTRISKRRGRLVLRNSDGKYQKQLATNWLHSKEHGDTGFSNDGTIMIVVCKDLGLAAIYSAGNADLLLNLDLQTLPHPESIAGMITNTHLVLNSKSGGIIVLDVGPGKLVALLSTKQHGKDTVNAIVWQLTPSGTVVLSRDTAGGVTLVRCHQFQTVKRSTTLQRMKSYTPTSITK